MNKKNENLVAFAAEERIGPMPAEPVGGRMYVANESRLTESTYNQPATDYLVGWAGREDLEATLESIAPTVEVGRRFEYKKSKDTESILSETDDVRAVGADFKRVEYAGDTVNAKTLNKGLTIRLDRDNYPPGDNAVERTAARLLRRIYRNELRRATTALLALDSGTGKTWTTTQDPDMDVINAVDAAGDGSGLDPNVVVFGQGAWLKRQACLRVQDKAGHVVSAGLTRDQVANLYGVERVEVIRTRYKTKKGGANSKALADYVVVCSLQTDPGTEDPSNIKRFVTPTDMGSRYAVYVEEHPKFVDVTVELYSLIASPTSSGAKQLTIS